MSRLRFPLIAVLIAACQPLAGPGGFAGLSGQWGGAHVGLDFKAHGATLDYDCAGGTIDGPLTIDLRGRFSGVGTHSPGHGGPDVIGQRPPRLPARYSGIVTGDRMTLQVDVDGGIVIGPYSLRRGAEPILFRCL